MRPMNPVAFHDFKANPAMTRGKILVIRGGAIGDFILTLPVLAALRQHFPNARLEVLGYPHIAQLAQAGGLADEVRSIEAGPLAGFFAQDGELQAGLRAYFAGFAVIISYLYDPDGIFQANVARCSKAQFIIGPHRPDETAGIHATEVFLKPLERLAIYEADRVPRLLTVRQKAEGRRQKQERPALALHPGSGSERKNWPERKWAELLGVLHRETPWRFLVVGGEAEGTKLARLAGLLPPDRSRLAHGLALGALAEELASCDAFLGHDSGISHLAAALEVPSLILWGPSVEAVWRPPGDNVAVLKAAEGLAALPVDLVVTHLKGMIDCLPAQLHTDYM